MNWEATAAIAELLGALGVIASLIYLASQVRSSGTQARQAAIQSVVNKMNTIYDHQAANPDHASLWVRGSRGLAHLQDEAERVQFSAFLCSIFKPYEEIFHYHRAGMADDWTRESIDPVCHALMSTPGFQEWWRLRSDWFSTEFRAHVEGILEGEPEYRRFDSSNVGEDDPTGARQS